MSLKDLADTPLGDNYQDTDVDAFADSCERLAADEATLYAADSLIGMAETAKRIGQVTDAMRRAVANIVQGAKDSEETKERNSRSRRYEGFGR